MKKNLHLRTLASALLFGISTCFFATFSFSEGSRQLQPTPESKTKLIVGSDRVPNYATYTSDSLNRLYIHISSTSEKIYVGFGKTFVDNEGLLEVPDLYYRIKSPDGTVFVQGTKVPKSGKGFITSDATSIGPIGLAGFAGGYDPIVIENLILTGDYYIEFSKTNSDVFDTPNALPRAIFEHFDITVGDGNTAKLGRLWSYRWHLSALGTDLQTEANFFVYTKDSVVTNVNLNKMQPFSFAVVANQMGTKSSTIFEESRKSTNLNSDYPEYKIFLNNPDLQAFPSYKSILAISSVKYNGYIEGGHCLEVKYNSLKPVIAELFLDFDSDGARDIEDRIMSSQFTDGASCILWDGKNGTGAAITAGSTFKVGAKVLTGLTNLPIFDPENNTQGFIVNLVRPQEKSFGIMVDSLPTIPGVVYWDDTQIEGGTANLLQGCSADGRNNCHWWTNNFGDGKTINTWWHASIRSEIFTVKFDNTLNTNVSKEGDSYYNVKVVPNPINANSRFRIVGNEEVVELEIINAHGNLVYSKNDYTLNDELNVPTLDQPGVYFIKLTNDKGNKTLKLVRM